MPLPDAFRLGDDLLARWAVENSPVEIPFYRFWAWMHLAGNPLKYARTNLLAPAELVGDCRVANEQVPTLSDAGFFLNEFITHYSICGIDLDTFQHPNRLDSVLFALAKRRLLYAYASFIVDGAQPASLVGQCDLTRRVDMGGAALTLDCLDDAFERVVSGEGAPTLIISNRRGLRTYRKLCRDAGFRPERVNLPGGDSVDAFNGAPWLVNDFINPPGLPPEERIFFMYMGDSGRPGPTRGVTGFMPAAQAGNPFIKRAVQGIFDPDATGPGSPGMRPGIDVWVSMPAGLAVASQGALSLIENFLTVADCGD